MDAGGEPVIFDPAVYYGDREADLAMIEQLLAHACHPSPVTRI
jgi:fructosamine-3-kinase